MNGDFSKIKDVFSGTNPQIASSSKRMLITPHINPDGDAIGSTLGCAYLANALGFDVRLLLATGIPRTLAWIENPWGHVTNIAELGSWAPDVFVTLDCGDARRPGKEVEDFLLLKKLPNAGWQNTISINIDHHTGNPEFADLNWVEPHWSSTGQMIGFLAEELGIALKDELGRAIYLTLISDTGGFSFSNTTGTVLNMAARIVDSGLKVGQFTANHENNWTPDRLQVWGKLMQDITFHADGKVASVIVPRSLFNKYDINKDDLDGFASVLRKVKGVKVGLYIREDGENLCKISLRSMGSTNVNPVAKAFGGGGHVAAAGAEIQLSPEEAREAVLEKLLEIV